MFFNSKDRKLTSSQSHHQLQDALDVGLATQASVHTCVSTYNKVIISCRMHYDALRYGQLKFIFEKTFFPASLVLTYLCLGIG